MNALAQLRGQAREGFADLTLALSELTMRRGADGAEHPTLARALGLYLGLYVSLGGTVADLEDLRDAHDGLVPVGLARRLARCATRTMHFAQRAPVLHPRGLEAFAESALALDALSRTALLP